MIDINGDSKIRQYFQETKKVEINLASVDKCKTPRSLILDLSKAKAMSFEVPVNSEISRISPNLTFCKRYFFHRNGSHFSSQGEKKLMLYCQAWAKNIDTERSFVDKVITKCQ